MNKAKSLRAQLLSKLTLPLLLLVLLDAAASYYVAMYYSDQAYDRWLLDSAKSLVQEVKAQQDHITFELPPIAVEVFRWDDMDETFYKVESQITGLMAGDAGVPSPDPASLHNDGPLFFDGEIDRQPVRVVSVSTVPAHSHEQMPVKA